MKNKNVGFLITGISMVVFVMIWLSDYTLRNMAAASCTHGPDCRMYDTINVQTWTSLAIAAIILIIGIFLFFSKEDERVIVKKIKEKTPIRKKTIDYSKLDRDEKKIVKALEESDGVIFQSDLVEKTGFSKVKVTRVLDRLEGRQLIERKRRGMTNIVVLKQ